MVVGLSVTVAGTLQSEILCDLATLRLLARLIYTLTCNNHHTDETDVSPCCCVFSQLFHIISGIFDQLHTLDNDRMTSKQNETSMKRECLASFLHAVSV